MAIVRLRPGWEGEFGRCVRDRHGQVKKRLVFPPGKAVTLRGADFAAVQGDIGKALEVVAPDTRGKLRRQDTPSDPPLPAPPKPPPAPPGENPAAKVESNATNGADVPPE